MKRWYVLLLTLALLVGGTYAARAGSWEPVEIAYGGRTYAATVEAYQFGKVSGGTVQLTAPGGPPLILFINGGQEMDMIPEEGVTLEVDKQGMPFYSAVRVMLLVGEKQYLPDAVFATLEGVTFRFDTRDVPDAIVLSPRGGGAGEEIVLRLSDEEKQAFIADSVPMDRTAIEPGAMRFTTGRVTYDVAALLDVPEHRVENLFNGLEGHAIEFAYEESDFSEAANKRLYSYTILITPEGEEVIVYANYGDRENPYTLFFGLPDGVWLRDCVLRVPGDAGDVLIPLDGGFITQASSSSAPPLEDMPEVEPSGKPEATAPEKGPGPEGPQEPGEEPEAEALQPGRMSKDALDAFLLALAEETSDPWQQAIYRAGADDVWEEDGALTFLLRPFDPNYKALGDYPGEDPLAWFERMLENVSAYTLKVSVTLNREGVPNEDGVKALRRAVRLAAEAAQEAFNRKAMRLAIVDQMFPMPIAKLDDVTALNADSFDPLYMAMTQGLYAITPEEAAPLFFAQVSQALNIRNGPHAMVLSCKGPEDAGQMLRGASTSALALLSRRYQANGFTADQIGEVLLGELIAQANSARKKGGASFALALDIDDLRSGFFGEDYEAYLAGYAYETVWDELTNAVWSLPDAPAQDYPENGRMSGGRNGTEVVVEAPDDGLARYVQVRAVDTDEVWAVLFIRPGKRVTCRVPQGMHYFMVASGVSWYGEEGLFGETGEYSRTEDTEVPGSSYKLTITLGGVVDGNMSSFGAGMEDFF